VNLIDAETPQDSVDSDSLNGARNVLILLDPKPIDEMPSVDAGSLVCVRCAEKGDGAILVRYRGLKNVD